MKKNYLYILIAALIPIFSGCSMAIDFTTSEKGARLYVDGVYAGTTKTNVYKLKKHQCVNVRFEKLGFFTDEIRVCYEGSTFGEVTHKQLLMYVDDAYESSIATDYANVDFEVEVNQKYSETEAWKIVSQIVTSYFDNLEMLDKETGYMKSAWQVKSFYQKTVRTRTIVKQSNSNPLKYKIKIVSEIAAKPEQSSKDDELFKAWDRILKKYSELIPEFQTRLGNK